METISFINQKGGAGKTTLCLNIASCLQSLNDSTELLASYVTVADADEQANLTDWQECGMGFTFDLIMAQTRQTLLTANKLAYSRKSKYFLIDTPGKLQDISAHVISLSDFIVVPLRPSPCDVWATLDTLSIIRSAMRANPTLKTLIVINQAIQHCTITKEVRALLAEHAPDFKVAEQSIVGRIDFAKSGMKGETIYQTKNIDAMKEIDALTCEILSYLNEPESK